MEREEMNYEPEEFSQDIDVNIDEGDDGVNVSDIFSEYINADTGIKKEAPVKRSAPAKKKAPSITKKDLEDVIKQQDLKYQMLMGQMKQQLDATSKTATEARAKQWSENYEKDWSAVRNDDIFKSPELKSIYNLDDRKVNELRALANQYAQPPEKGGLGQVFYPDQMVMLDSYKTLAKEYVELRKKMDNYKGIYRATATNKGEQDVISSKLRAGEIDEATAIQMELEQAGLI